LGGRTVTLSRTLSDVTDSTSSGWRHRVGDIVLMLPCWLWQGASAHNDV
jgi:hypothetical protein